MCMCLYVYEYKQTLRAKISTLGRLFYIHIYIAADTREEKLL